MSQTAIIVAGGSGSRMQGTLPKQFLPLLGMPVLMHTINKFNDGKTIIVVVLPVELHAQWKELCNENKFAVKHSIANGGATRSESVYNGLKSLTNTSGCVAVHDAARPLVTATLIANLFALATANGNAVPVVSVKDSIREINNSGNHFVDRNKLRAVQTPQVFNTQMLLAAFHKLIMQNSPLNFSDEATLMEHYGEEIFLTEGEHTNIKLTYPYDLVLAETILKSTL